MRYTKEDIKSLGICPDYTDERLDELASGRKSLSERELAELDIPIDDRIYLLGKLCADERNTMARRIARDVIPLWNRSVPEIVKRYLETGESDIKAAARDAARAAARDAAWAAAEAARAAAEAARAAAEAAWAAAWDAAWAAAEAAWDAAWAAAEAAMAAAIAAGDAVIADVMLKAKDKYLGWMVEFCESREGEK